MTAGGPVIQPYVMLKLDKTFGEGDRAIDAQLRVGYARELMSTRRRKRCMRGSSISSEARDYSIPEKNAHWPGYPGRASQAFRQPGLPPGKLAATDILKPYVGVVTSNRLSHTFSVL
ncbi:hypothetical protein LMG26686_04337 [Achromobacter mucicolens]|nr:hypothetical protein LMG26686_04337 [Achromobacter mucicolens]